MISGMSSPLDLMERILRITCLPLLLAKLVNSIPGIMGPVVHFGANVGLFENTESF